MTLARLVALCGLVLLVPDALAARLEIPLRVPLELVRHELARQLAASPERPNVIFREGRCRYLTLDSPRLEPADGGELRFAGPGAAALGFEILGACRNAVAWRGAMQFTLAPQLDAAGRLRMRIVDSQLTDENGEKAGALAFVWDLTKRYVHPRLEAFSFDLGASRASLLAALRGAAPPQHAAALEASLARLQVLAPRVEAGAVVVPVAFDVPEPWLAPPTPLAASAAPLTEAEIDALDQSLQPWDAFLVHALKQVALDSSDPRLHQRLFTLLLESRYQLVAILAGEADSGGDPVRTLFADTWSELRTILADAQREGVLDPSLLRYALFIDSGDALVALERAAPGLGVQITADGLRRLARSLSPTAVGDPLAWSDAVDPQLAQLFDVAALPEPIPAPAAPAAPQPRSFLDLLIRSARAAGEPVENARSLDRWVPKRDELDLYKARVDALLNSTAATELQRTSLGAPYTEVYRNIVPTTALIESCWHQYVVRGGKVTYLRSAVGSIGIMQINQRVWRGFYDVQRLRWDTAYNTRAGAQILMRYIRDYAVPYAEKHNDPTLIPRATYAVYNAGPRAVGRFNKAKRHPREARVDDKLWMLYRGIAAGAKPDLTTCSVSAAAPQ